MITPMNQKIQFIIQKDKKVLSLDSRSNTKLEIYSDEETSFKDKPIVILINSKTASAAEILAGALKCSAGAILIGENTYGKQDL